MVKKFLQWRNSLSYGKEIISVEKFLELCYGEEINSVSCDKEIP